MKKEKAMKLSLDLYRFYRMVCTQNGGEMFQSYTFNTPTKIYHFKNRVDIITKAKKVLGSVVK